MFDRPHFVAADAWGTNPIEMFSLEEQKERLVLASGLNLKQQVREIIHDAPAWLPIAAEAMNISPNIKDYILVPVISMPSDLPNRNGVAFPFAELTRWNYDVGSVMFKTWRGKCCHVEHQNKDPLQARGLILECMMKPIAGAKGNIWKVIKLSAWDRNKDPIIANDILSNPNSSFSMGAFCRDYQCSICGQSPTNGGCEHVSMNKPDFKIYDGKVAHYNAYDPIGFELSKVQTPAYVSAVSNHHFML